MFTVGSIRRTGRRQAIVLSESFVKGAGGVQNRKRVLISWVYHTAYGHVVEALEASASVMQGNPGVDVSLLLTKSPGVQLVQYAPWVSKTWIIDPKANSEEQIRGIPEEWDHVVYSASLSHEPEKWYSGELLNCNRLLQSHLKGRDGVQFERARTSSGNALSMPAFPDVKLQLPEESRIWAKQHRRGSGPVFALLLSGSLGATHAPRIGQWHKIIQRLSAEHDGAEFWVVGTSHRGRFGFCSEQTRQKMVAGLQGAGRVRLLLDVGLEKQLALMEEADVFVSTHTGFAFLASCLGTPWLCLSGGAWPDVPIGHTPFWFSMPACSLFPCWGREKLECSLRRRLRQPIACLDGMLASRLDDIAEGATRLLSGTLSFEACFEVWQRRLQELGLDQSRVLRLHDFLKSANA